MVHHHAYLLSASSIESAAIPSLYKTQVADVTHVIRERFSIDDARMLTSWSLQQPFELDKRVFVIQAQEIAPEAQNALLKLFEEPPEHALFYILLTKTSFLLPTLLSRLHTESSTSETGTTNNEFSAFQSMSYSDRMQEIASKTKEKESDWVELIVAGCESAALQTKGEYKRTFLKAIMLVRTYIRTKGASPKMLLEELALQLPIK